MKSDNQWFWKLDLCTVVCSPSVISQELFQRLINLTNNETSSVGDPENKNEFKYFYDQCAKSS